MEAPEFEPTAVQPTAVNRYRKPTRRLLQWPAHFILEPACGRFEEPMFHLAAVY